MERVAPQTPFFNPGITYSAALLAKDSFSNPAGEQAEEIAFELGLWLAGLECFLSTWDHSPEENNRPADSTRNWTKEFRLTHSALLICSRLNYRLRKTLSDSEVTDLPISLDNSNEFSSFLRDTITLNGSFIQSEYLEFSVWKSWSVLLYGKLRDSKVVGRFTGQTGKSTDDYLPANLKKLLQSKPIPFADRADLEFILPRFAKILKFLSVIGRMVKDDEPLKPTLLIFSKVYEESEGLINYINNRLARFPDETADLFNSLDSASYSASLELKKVYQQELTGLVGIRPAPTIYARIETAYALLNDSFEQILAGFARLIEPGIAVNEVFPHFQKKLEQSLMLRKHLWQVLQAVKAAEHSPDKRSLGDLNRQITLFVAEPTRYLFFKDKETIERFSEEVFATTDKKDLVPILHRFGAYLETLFSQVNMRNVLGAHPFEEKN
ncbi:MAG: hypothetical protein M3Q26_12460 [Acidobacteriota bacterium]|nr:hypothetical protein [Acidobacteriota bacterium]